ncbi:hypothetical protein HNQ88_002256 [Aureibacter tunicatorum]|uniref:Uncharacterized protein n=1 Tax=Aureibacter tunicatorum TaxID=866807 RepID=A0AAE3XNM6_9BACT|nr:hypothetical protein [Aureibacter tunicatorum]BDD04856.1 hypothetical protein AUTU_23390 [Aureibacter tunicatorum]
MDLLNFQLLCSLKRRKKLEAYMDEMIRVNALCDLEIIRCLCVKIMERIVSIYMTRVIIVKYKMINFKGFIL